MTSVSVVSEEINVFVQSLKNSQTIGEMSEVGGEKKKFNSKIKILSRPLSIK